MHDIYSFWQYIIYWPCYYNKTFIIYNKTFIIAHNPSAAIPQLPEQEEGMESASNGMFMCGNDVYVLNNGMKIFMAWDQVTTCLCIATGCCKKVMTIVMIETECN